MLNKRYKHIFFDLDRTLWDFDRNASETLEELFHETGLVRKGIPGFDLFLSRYHEVNNSLWDLYRRGEMSREVLSAKRFRLTFESYGIEDPDFAVWFGEEYLLRAATRDHTYPGAREVLEYLKARYSLHILTNGFRDVQYSKLKHSGLRQYFRTILSSEEIGISKPDMEIFSHALERAGAKTQESLMIGDDPHVDIEGAKKAGIDQVWFNPAGKKSELRPTYEIKTLNDLTHLL